MTILTAADVYDWPPDLPYTDATTVILHLGLTPPPDGAPGGTPVVARIDHGRWIGDCLLTFQSGPRVGEVCHNAQYLDPDDPRFWCVACANEQLAGLWRDVTWPEDQAAVEALLDGLPLAEQNWTP